MKPKKRLPPGYGAEFQFIHCVPQRTMLAEAHTLKAIHQCAGVEIAMSAYLDLAEHKIVGDLYRTAEDIGIHDLLTKSVPDYTSGVIQVICAVTSLTDLIALKMAVA